jgi:hypothetical protein
VTGQRRVVYDDAGEVAAVYCGHLLGEQDRAAMLDLVAAVRRRFDEEPPEVRANLEMRQQLAQERNRARLARIRGEVDDAE